MRGNHANERVAALPRVGNGILLQGTAREFETFGNYSEPSRIQTCTAFSTAFDSAVLDCLWHTERISYLCMSRKSCFQRECWTYQKYSAHPSTFHRTNRTNASLGQEAVSSRSVTSESVQQYCRPHTLAKAIRSNQGSKPHATTAAGGGAASL